MPICSDNKLEMFIILVHHMHAIRYFETKDVNKASGGFEREKGKEEEECPKLVHRETITYISYSLQNSHTRRKGTKYIESSK